MGVPVTISSRRVLARRNLHTEGAEARVPRSADMTLRTRTGCTMERMAAIRPHGSGAAGSEYCNRIDPRSRCLGERQQANAQHELPAITGGSPLPQPLQLGAVEHLDTQDRP